MEPSLTSVGDYVPRQVLSEGGMGVVYRATDRRTGLEVALKTVRQPSGGLLASLRREIQVLARLEHPGIVRILGEGVQGGIPWYAMELIEGDTLNQCRRKLLGALPTVPALEPPQLPLRPAARNAEQGPGADSAGSSTVAVADEPAGPEVTPSAALAEDTRQAAPAEAEPLREASLRELLTVIRRLCATLSYLHGEGIVHRDLKPLNIVVRPGGWPVILDFGLTLRLLDEDSRDWLELNRLVLKRLVLGTPPYMAPEQIRDDLVDARADLYALGCILYEMLTGRPPFLGEQLDVLRQHLWREPTPPSQLVAGVPGVLDALILKLLAKDPAERYGHADDVAMALGALGAGDCAWPTAPSPRAYLYRPRLAGRGKELRQIESLWDALLARKKGAAVLLSGESGAGKTRLVAEIGRRAPEGVQIWTGQCRPAGIGDDGQPVAGEPLHPLHRLLQAVADRCREHETPQTETDRLLGARGKVLAPWAPALRDLPGQHRSPEPDELPPPRARHRLFEALSQTMKLLCERAPAILVLDDLQWADELTLGWLESVLRSRSHETMGLLIVGTHRSEELDSPRRAAIDALELPRLVLEPLDEQAVTSMVCDMLAMRPPPSGLAQELLRLSEGNPFFVAEYLLASVHEGSLQRDAEGVWYVAGREAEREDEPRFGTPGLPRSVRELVGRRLAGLPEAARRLVTAASVLGRELDEAVALETSGLEDAAVPGALLEVRRRHVLEPAPRGLWRFTHDQIREAAYASVPQASLPALHGRAAEAIEKRFGAGSEEHQASLGLHWERAGRPERARASYLNAARRAASALSYGEAERLYRSVLRLMDGLAAESVRVRNELGFDVLQLQGKNEQAVTEYRAALDEARSLGDRSGEGQCLEHLGWALQALDRLQEAREAHEQALVIAEQFDDRQAEGSALAGLASVFGRLGDADRAREFHVRAETRSKEPATALERRMLRVLGELDAR